MSLPGAPPPKPIPIKERTSLVFVQKTKLDVKDGAFVAVAADGSRTHIPIGGVACLMLEPGVRISHAAVSLASRVGTLVVWIGEAGVRLYAAGQPGGARSDKILWQAALNLDNSARLKIVREMYRIRFNEAAPLKRSIEQLRGIEGARVRHTYSMLANQYGVTWKRRKYNPYEWDASDLPNKCLSAGTACLHGLVEAAVLAAGYAPSIGFLHTGKARSFVYDIADLWKTKTVVPIAFGIAAKKQKEQIQVSVERAVRLACRDSFRSTGLLAKIIPQIENVLKAGGLSMPSAAPEAQKPAIKDIQGIADVGHRS